MEFVSGQVGRSSLYFLVGYAAALATFSLAVSAKTPVYSGIVNTVRLAPLPSAILGAPLVSLMGVLIHIFRSFVQSHLLRQGTHKISVLSDSELNSLRIAAETALPSGFIPPAFERPGEFERPQAQVDPEFNPYRAHERWLYDLLADLVPIASFAVIVVFARAIVFSLSGLDWVILITAAAVLLIAGVSIPRLRIEFTIRDVAVFVAKCQFKEDNETTPRTPQSKGSA